MRIPTARGTRGSASLPLSCEEPLGRELALQLLEREQVVAEPDPLDRRRPEPELLLWLVDLRAPRDVNRLALVEMRARGGR